MNEKPLHAALKEWYAQPGDRFEVSVDGFVVDLVRDDLLIEVQTRNFAAIRDKLIVLVTRHPVRLVCPIPSQKWIVRLDGNGSGVLGRRRSPRRGVLPDLFGELVHLPRLIEHPNFSLEVLLTHEEEVRRRDARRGWRRGGLVIHERRLLQVVGRHLFKTPQEIAALIPSALADPFTTGDLAAALGRSPWLAGRMAYCLRELGLIVPLGKRGRSLFYERVKSDK